MNINKISEKDSEGLKLDHELIFKVSESEEHIELPRETINIVDRVVW